LGADIVSGDRSGKSGRPEPEDNHICFGTPPIWHERRMPRRSIAA
jgi:hypothetical protein